MSNAKTYPVGNDKMSRKRKTGETVPTVSRICRSDEKIKGCTGDSKRQKKVSANSHVANGFLRTTFLPKLMENDMPQASDQSAKLERDFFESLSRLAEHYSIEPFCVDKFEFPYNISLALSDIKRKLKQKVPNWNSVSIIKEDDKFYLASEECFDTGATLFYIPVVPVFRMLNDKRRRKAGHLMLSVFSYLYHIADIPYYMQEGSYLYYEYEILKDWIVEDPNEDEEDEEDDRLHEINVAEWVGEKIEQKIYNRHNLTCFEDRIGCFNPKDQFDFNCLELARKTLAIYKTYPDASIFGHASSMLDEDGEYVEDDIIPMEQYISFYADNRGWLAGSIFDMVNNQFQEYNQTQEPAIIKCFDGRVIEPCDFSLSFETDLFDLLHDITDIIYDYRKLNDEK